MDHTRLSSLTAALGPRAATVSICLYDTIDSTNTEAKRRASIDAGIVLYLSRAQTSGRGRLGRSFHSPATGLYMTLSMTTDRPLGEVVSITAMTAVAAAATVEAVTGKHPGIKWVNDLYLDGGKLAGILTEAVTLPADADGRPRTRLIIGLGMNITTTEFPADLRAPATSLLSPTETAHLTVADLDALTATIAGGVVCRLLALVENSSEALPHEESCLAYYRRHLLYIGERVLCTRGHEAFEGIVRGVDDGYSLLVDVAGETRALSSGEISVRLAE